MKNIFRFSALLAICSLFSLTGCTEELSTDQFDDDAVVFSAFAPNPVVRGAELRIMGSNLDKIVEVQIPGADPITQIEVVSTGRISEIKVVTPAAGAEDISVTGPVVIKDKSGNTYKSKADITFKEGIVLESFSPANAMPGDEITVRGDYLYNVQQVRLNNDVFITGDQITSKNRRELKFRVPSDAVTGPVTIGDVDENNNPDGLIANNIPSKVELVIGDPTVTSADRGMLKAGAKIVVKGTYLDMIEKAAFMVTTPAAEEGAEATVAYTEVDFALAEDNKSITVVLPATVVEGEVVLTSYAGKQFKAGAYTTVVPTEVAIAAETRYKAGLGAVVTGKDLDLVTGADLAGTALEFVYNEGKIAFDIPAAAVDGVVTLTLANGKTVATEAIELVKPVITAVSPLELYAGDEPVVVTGEDLDLVVSATLGGTPEEIELSDDGTLRVGTTVSSVKGKVVLTAANGYTVESVEEISVNYHALVIVNEMPAMQHIGQEVVLKGSNFRLVENIFIGDVKVTDYSLRTDTEVRFLMPWNKVGSYNIKFHLFSGDVETLATPIEVGLELDIKTLWEGEQHITWTGMDQLSWGKYDFSAVKPGTVLTAYFTLDENPEYDPQMRFADGNWNSLPSGVAIAGGEGNIIVGAGATYYSIKLTADDLAVLREKGLVMTGTFYTLTKVTLTSEIPQDKTIWEGNVTLDWADPGKVYLMASDFAGVEAGAKLKINYFIPKATWGQAQINYGNWTKIIFPELDKELVPTDIHGWSNDQDRDLSDQLTLTQEVLDNIQAKKGNNDALGINDFGIVIQGEKITIKSIVIVP